MVIKLERNTLRYNQYIDLLKSELVKAMGCTEPIALAYAASKAREILGELPVKIEASVSANIIKNVKSVIVPNTGGSKGIASAIIAGVLFGDASRKLEVLEGHFIDASSKIKEYGEKTPIEITSSKSDHIFDIGIKAYSNNHKAYVRIVDAHTNIVKIEYDGKSQAISKEDVSCSSNPRIKKTGLEEFIKTITIKEIYDFSNTCHLEDVEDILDEQIRCNMAIALEGMKNNYGANIGKVLMKTYGDSVNIKARAYAAAGSDARMNGCLLPVVINSGSGNQGMTASIPVIIYAKELNKSKESLYRALLISNLSTIHIKSGIGILSAYCGAVAAGCGSGAGICYLLGGDCKAISHTLVNALAINSGIVCDGAKASCAAKISSAVDAGVLGYYMYQNGNQFLGGDGIVKKGVENTIYNVGLLAREGMKITDKEIIKIMLDDE